MSSDDTTSPRRLVLLVIVVTLLGLPVVYGVTVLTQSISAPMALLSFVFTQYPGGEQWMGSFVINRNHPTSSFEPGTSRFFPVIELTRESCSGQDAKREPILQERFVPPELKRRSSH